jgi:hydrogenase expression/formation protein HypD
MAIARNGIREMLPDNVSLISGPGCPVCVTPNETIDWAVAVSRLPSVMVTTFGDMMKVPGSSSSLDREHARGGNIRVVTSTLEALALAREHTEKQVVFLGVGFETTAPTVAAAILEAKKYKLSNFYVLSAHKVMPPAMEALSGGRVNIDGYLCPGHVSTVIGSVPYEPLARDFQIACVIAGFEPLDILQAMLMLVRQVKSRKPAVEIQYKRAVKPGGNPRAQAVLDRVFQHDDAEWRGIGSIPGSGLAIRDEFAALDAFKQIQVEVEPSREPRGCLCGKVLQGLVKPVDCPHFGKSCSPGHPVGPCMVSSEGTCAAYFKYHRL